MAATEQVPVDRREEYQFGGGFREELHESPLDVYDLVQKADSADVNKMSFNIRSPASQLLCSPLAWVETEVVLTVPYALNQMSQASCGVVYRSNEAATLNAQDGANRSIGKQGLIAWGGGDAFGSALDHASVVLNGSSFTISAMDSWWSSFVKTQISSKDAARRFHSCGGGYDRDDARMGKAFTKNTSATNAGRGFGFSISGDSAVQERARRLYKACHIKAQGTVGPGGGTEVYRISVAWPICVPPFNSFIGLKSNRFKMAVHKFQPLGLSNINQLSMTLLFKNLIPCLIRELSDRSGAFGSALNNIGTGSSAAAITGTIDASKTQMRVRYYRLAASRRVPSVQQINTMKYLVTQSDAMPVADPGDGSVVAVPATVLRDAITGALPPSGFDRLSKTSTFGNSAMARRTLAPIAGTAYYKAELNNISYPQLPDFLILVFQKDVESYRYSSLIGVNDHMGMRPVYNLTANASIRKISVRLNTSEHVYSFSSDASALVDARRLYADTIRNCCSDYFDFDQWRDSQCCVVLSSDSYAPLGLISPGVISPIQLSVECQIENRHVVVSGTNAAYGHTDMQDDNAQPQEPILGGDLIRGKLTMVAVFGKGVVSIMPSSCTQSAQGISQSQAAEILSRTV